MHRKVDGRGEAVASSWLQWNCEEYKLAGTEASPSPTHSFNKRSLSAQDSVLGSGLDSQTCRIRIHSSSLGQLLDTPGSGVGHPPN
jgi:hypothetical protein